MSNLNLRPQTFLSRGASAIDSQGLITQAKETLLQRQWMFWYHTPCNDDDKYEGSRECLHKEGIKSVFDFWCHFNNIRGPSDFIGANQRAFKRPIAGWSFFETGIKPDWEDPKNVNGMSLTFKIQSDGPTINNIWREILLGLVGETIPHSNSIVGARITYKNKTFRLELWTSIGDLFVVNEIRVWTEEKIPKTSLCTLLLYYDTPHTPQQKGAETLSKPQSKKPRPKPIPRFKVPHSNSKK